MIAGSAGNVAVNGWTRPCVLAIVAWLTGAAPSSVIGADYSISGFGTVGYARSSESFAYHRFIDSSGTFKRDSVAGVQVDAKFTDYLGATVQVVGEPASNNDARYQANVAWAFLSWRPTNDWLFRVGKQRIPFYLYSQTYNVGVTYDFVRPPIEMYSLTPNNDYVGASFSKTWSDGPDEVTLDGNWGKSNADIRVWLRDDIPTLQKAGQSYRKVALQGFALNLAYKHDEDTYRVGVSRSLLVRRDRAAIPATFPFVPIFPGVGYFQVDPALPGPGIPTTNQVELSVLTLGADVGVGLGVRVLGEFARTVGAKTDLSATSNRGYLSALRPIGKWTPYVTYSFLRSADRALNLNRALNSSSVPGFIPGAALINAAQRAGADQVQAYDQRAVAIGAAYSLSSTQKIKGELMRVRIGRFSSLVDSPPGGDVQNQGIGVISISYSFVF